MAPRLRRDESAVASTVAVMLTLFVILLFLDAAVVSVAPQQQYTAEWVTSHQALQSLDMMRSALSGPALPGSTFSVAIPVGTPATSPFATASEGALQFDDTNIGGPTISFTFVPHFLAGQLTKVDQDVILLMDSSGSMTSNDPQNLRIAGAKGYLGSLTAPDRVAIVDFDSCARLTRLVVESCSSSTGIPTTTGVAHHLYAIGHNGDPNYEEAKTDLDLIDSSGGTNYAVAIKIANDEFSANGDKKHQWAEILLTDGANCGGSWQKTHTPCKWDYDPNPFSTQSMARQAKALGITIYTIELYNNDPANLEHNESLLQYVAATTGGTFYQAVTPEDIRWIYFGISRRYAGAFACGEYVAADLALGSVSLTLASTQYPRQTFRMEGGALSVLQTNGASIHAGLPLKYTPTSNASGELSMALLTFTGAAFSAVGTENAIVQARVISRDVEDQHITKVDLREQASAVSNTSANLKYWANQGAATQAAANAIRTPLEQANGTIRWADANATTGQITSAKFNIDRAQSQLSAALQEIDNQKSLGQIQSWLAKQSHDEIAVVGCRLDQWLNWYDGITIRIDSPAAAAWAIWLNQTFGNVGDGVSIGLSGSIAVLSIHAIDRLVLDRRIVELSLGR